MPVAQALEELGEKRRQTLGANAVGGRPAHAQKSHLSRSIATWAATHVPVLILSGWITQEHQRVLAGVAGDRTELVQKLALLPSAATRVARRQSSRQVMPTGLLHCLIVIALSRISFEADRPCRVDKILRQRAFFHVASWLEHAC